jgi:hypothetical protein
MTLVAFGIGLALGVGLGASAVALWWMLEPM